MRPRYVRSIDNWDRVEKQIRSWSEMEREMRSGRSWTPITKGAVFARYWRQSLLLQPGERLQPGGLVCVGVDHGLIARRNRATCSVVYNLGDHQEIWTMAEYAPEGATTPKQDGRGIVEMVVEAGLTPSADPLKCLHSVDIWVGDRPIQNRADVRKSNRRLVGGIRAHLAEVYDREISRYELPEQLREISTPIKKQGRQWTVISFLQDLMIAGHTRFHPRMVQGIKDLQTWEGKEKAPGKDFVDAWRYPVERAMQHYGVWRW